MLLGGTRGGRPRPNVDRLLFAERKKMHAVANRPTAPAVAVRRTTLSRANSAVHRAAPFGIDSPLSRAGAANTIVIRASDVNTARTKRSRGSQGKRRRTAIHNSC